MSAVVLDLGFLFTAQQAEEELGIPASTVRTWAQRSQRTGLLPYGMDSRHCPAYWEADLRALRLGLRIRDDDGERVIRDVDDVRT